jgi:hypothetical protein
VVRNDPKIRKAEGVSFDSNTIFINPDLTILQREDEMELRTKLKKKRETDPNWIIKKGRIVRKAKPREPVGRENAR